MRSDRTLLKSYKTINKRFFDGACPERVCVRWADPNDKKDQKLIEGKYFGWANVADNGDFYHTHQIVMCRTLNERWITKISTLIHEMIHLATNLTDDHGAAFEKWREYVSARGIFKKHAIRKNRALF